MNMRNATCVRAQTSKVPTRVTLLFILYTVALATRLMWNQCVELALKLLLFHVLISTPYDMCMSTRYAITMASVMKNFNKKIDRKNLNFSNKTAI